MASVNHTRPHCVNQMGKTHSKSLAARRGRGKAWARHVMCESALKVRLSQSAFHREGPWDNRHKSSLAIELGTKRGEIVLGIAVTMTDGGDVPA